MGTKERGCSKKSVRQGRSHFGERNALSVRERQRREERQVCEPEGGKMARTPLAAFFNIPMCGYLAFIIFLSMALGCTKGRWVQHGASPERTHQDLAECETLASLQPPPFTLSEKQTANPDLSSLTIQKCMQNLGYQWVTDSAPSQQEEILKIGDRAEPLKSIIPKRQ